MQPIIPMKILLTIHKFFLRPHLDFGNVIYDRVFNESLQINLESSLYNFALAITAAIRGSSREKLCQKLGLELLKLRRWYQNLCFFFDIIPKFLSRQTTTNYNNIPLFNVKHEYFRNSFFFHPLLLSGISSIIIFKIRNRLVLLKKKSLNLSDQVLIERLMCIIIMELNYLQDYE